MAIRNILTNSSFDTGGTWRFHGINGISPGVGMDGTNGIHFPNTASGSEQFIFQNVNLVKGASYTLSCWFRSAGPSMILYANLRYRKINGNVGWVYLGAIGWSGTGTWLWREKTFIMPTDSNGTLAEITVNAGGDAGQSASFWVDDVELVGDDAATRNPTLPSYPDPPGALSNRVFNGDFNHYGGWRATENVDIDLNSTEAIGGSGGVLVLPSGPDGLPGVVLQDLALVFGEEHTLSFWAKRRGLIDIYCYVLWYINGVQHRGPIEHIEDRTFETWTRHDLTFTLPNVSPDKAELAIVAQVAEGDTATAFVDSVALYGPEVGMGPAHYVELTREVSAFDMNGIPCAYPWPEDRRVIVQHYDSHQYSVLYQGNQATLAKNACRTIMDPPRTHEYFQDTIEFLAEPEMGQTESRYYDNAMGSWCQTFINWLIRAAHMPSDRYPVNQSNTGFAICDWINLYGNRFFFATAEHKQRFKAAYPQQLGHLDDSLSLAEMQFVPTRGDIVYLRLRDGDNVSHVAWVSRNESTLLTCIEGNAADTEDVKRTYYTVGQDYIVGYARPDYFPFG